MVVKILLCIFPLLAVLSTHVLASDENVPEDNSDAGTNIDITIESTSISEDLPSDSSANDSSANTDEQVVDYEDALKKMDEEMMIKE
jgi:hypothetical protein